jgi:hypothetical protein
MGGVVGYVVCVRVVFGTVWVSSSNDSRGGGGFSSVDTGNEIASSDDRAIIGGCGGICSE